MISTNYWEDNEHAQFNFDQCVDWQQVIPLVENNFADAKEFKANGDPNLEYAPASVEDALDSYMTINEQYGEIFGKKVGPSSREMDEDPATLKDGKVTLPKKMVEYMNLLIDSGLMPYKIGRRYGGLAMPLTAQMPIMEIVGRADIPFGMALSCFNLSSIIEKFGSDELKQEYVPRMAAGEMISAMALTEPNHGSDLPNILTKAVKNGDGTYELTGTKRFITHGCGFEERPCGILTLARTGAAGARGLSFFVVESTDVEVARLEHKMAMHASPTCEIVYEKSKGRIIGEEGKGLIKYSMSMMNGARVGVAIKSLGLALAAYKEAEKYAAERVQSGRTINKIPAVAMLLEESQALIFANRALIYRSAEITDMYDGLILTKKTAGESEKEIRRDEAVLKWDRLAKLLTPITKLVATEHLNKIAYDCVQVFGGAGWTEEYDIGKIYREARITSIYEGTSQMQVLAAVGGIVEGGRAGGFIDDYFTEQLALIKDKEKRAQLQRYHDEFLELVDVYKNKEKETRDRLSWDLVFHFTYVFMGVLVSQQVERDFSKVSADYKEAKTQATHDYLLVAARELAGHAAHIRAA